MIKDLMFDLNRKFDIILLGRVAIDFNPAYSDAVKEEFKPLKDVHYFEKFVGGSPANIAVGLKKYGLNVGFIGQVSDDQFGDFVSDYFAERGIDTSHISRSKNGEKLGLTFTEMLSPSESSILMYRNQAADLQLSVEDICEEYIKGTKAILISGTALAQSPSREAAIKATMLAKKHGTHIIFDIDFRNYNWKNSDEIAIYYSLIASYADVILGSREEFNLTEKLIESGRTDEQTATYWFAHNAKIVVIKHGASGSTAYCSNGEQFTVQPFIVSARKGFGGGDGYASGFLYGLFEGWPLAQCLEFASAAAAMMVSSNNCSDDLPNAEQVTAFIATNNQNDSSYKAEKKDGEI